MSEANAITAGLLEELPKRYLHIRVWRNNRVKARAIGRGGRTRMISAGVDGQADISGIIGPFGRRVEIEVKAGDDRLRTDQRNFRMMILDLGGVHVTARSVEGAMQDLDIQLREEEREERSADINGRGRIRPLTRARQKRATEPTPSLCPDPDYGGPAGTPQARS